MIWSKPRRQVIGVPNRTPGICHRVSDGDRSGMRKVLQQSERVGVQTFESIDRCRSGQVRRPRPLPGDARRKEGVTMKFEYKTVYLERSNLTEIDAELCRFGNEGWEMIDAVWRLTPNEKPSGAGTFIFKRRVEPILTTQDAIRLVGELFGADPEKSKTARLLFSGEVTPAELAEQHHRDEDEDSHSSDGPQIIRPLSIDKVAVCTGSNCEQFDIVKYKCNIAGVVIHGTACPVWYERKGENAPCGVVHFIREQPESVSEGDWEPLVKEAEEAMGDFAHYEKHRTRTEARRAVVEVVLQAIESTGFRVS